MARRRRNTQHPHINCASRSFMSRRRRASFLQLYKVARHYWLIRRAGHAMLWRLGGELFADIKIPLGSFRYITRTVSWMQNVFGYWSPKSMYSEVVDIHFFFIRFHERLSSCYYKSVWFPLVILSFEDQKEKICQVL